MFPGSAARTTGRKGRDASPLVTGRLPWLTMGAKIRLCRAVAPVAGGLDVLAAWGLIAADVPVGSCECGGRAYGTEVRRPRRGARWWLTAECASCGAGAASPGVWVDGEPSPASPAVPEPAERWAQYALPMAR